MGHSHPLFSLFSSFQQLPVNMFVTKFCQWLDWNRWPLVSEATALSTEPQPLPYLSGSLYLFDVRGATAIVALSLSLSQKSSLSHIRCIFFSPISSFTLLPALPISLTLTKHGQSQSCTGGGVIEGRRTLLLLTHTYARKAHRHIEIENMCVYAIPWSSVVEVYEDSYRPKW